MKNGIDRIDRRTFVLSGAAFAMLQGCATWSGACSRGAKKWYKGNLHTHTFWSDGKAFPEEAVAW